MSDMSAGQWVGGIVGAIIGFVGTGYNPAGAVQGFAIGAGIGGYIDPPPGPNLRGPTLSDKSFQSSAYGVAIPRLYGTIATMGNIIYLENNEYKAVSKKEEQGGKGGGGGATVTTTTYFATFAVALGEASPGSVVRRVWAGGKLIFSAGTDDMGTLLQSAMNAGTVDKVGANTGWNYYDGTQTEPDSRMEAVLGVGNCPSYEGTAYIIFYDFDLTDYGNGLAGCPIKVEIATGSYSEKGILTYDTPGQERLRGCTGLFYQGSLYYFYPRFWPSLYETSFSYSGNVTSNKVVFGSDSMPDLPDIYEGTWTRTIAGINSEVKGWFHYFRGISPNSYYCVCAEGYGEIQFLRTSDWYNQGVGSVVHLPEGLGFSFFRQQNFAGPGSEREHFVYAAGNFLAVAKADFPAFGFMSDGRLITVDDDDNSTGLKPRTIKIYSLISGWTLQQSFTLNLPRLDCRSAVFNIGDSIYIFDEPDSASSLTDTTVDFWILNIETGEEKSGVVPFGVSMVSSGYEGGEANYLWGYKSGVFGVTAPIGVSGSDGARFFYFTLSSVDAAGQDLAEIVTEIFDQSGLTAFDVSQLDGEIVDGYRTDGIISGRAALSALQATYLFDVIESGYSINCVRRAVEPVASIPHENLIMSGNGNAVSVDREQESRLHSRYQITYLDFNREYDPSVQVSEYPSLASNTREEQIPIVMSADRAAKTADILHGLEWIERESFSFSVPQNYLQLKLADVVNVEIRPGVWRLMRIASNDKSAEQVVAIQAKATQYGAYTSISVGVDVDPPSEIVPLLGVTYSHLLDIPMLLEQQDTFGFVAATYGDVDTWPGGVLMGSPDSGQTYTALSAFYGAGTVAAAGNALGVSDGFVIERNTSLTVSMLSGTLSSITEEQMMLGLHYCAYGADGRWEIIQFANANLLSSKNFLLSTFTRGLFGTEWASGLHQVGDILVLLQDPDNQFIGRPAQSVGVENLYKAVTVGSAVAAAAEFSLTYNAVNLKPLSVVDIRGERNIGNDLFVNFFPRTRYASNFWVTGNQPQNEPVLLFEADILNGASVVRTISTSLTSFTYTEAEQIADFGAAQASVDVIIYQISARVGRGFPAEATL